MFDNAKAISEQGEYYGDWANAEISLQNFEDAINVNSKAIEIDPQYANTYCNRALAKEELGDIEGAAGNHDKGIKDDQDLSRDFIEKYDKFNAINPNDVKTVVNRGNSRLQLDLPEESMADFNQVI